VDPASTGRFPPTPTPHSRRNQMQQQLLQGRMGSRFTPLQQRSVISSAPHPRAGTASPAPPQPQLLARQPYLDSASSLRCQCQGSSSGHAQPPGVPVTEASTSGRAEPDAFVQAAQRLQSILRGAGVSDDVPGCPAVRKGAEGLVRIPSCLHASRPPRRHAPTACMR
jgi:hypothetical protein